MALPARPESSARCPWCSADVSLSSAECPSCRFPLRADAPAGPADRPTAPRPIASLDLGSAGNVRALVERREGDERRERRRHRMAVAASLLAVTAAILTLSTVLSLRAVNSPGAKADRRAQADLASAFRRADAGQPVTDGPTPLVVLQGDVGSDAHDHISINGANGLWFAASRSASGRCFAVGGRLGQHGYHVTLLAAPAACTGDAARDQLAGRIGPA